MQIRNRTSLAAEGVVDLDARAREQWLIALKARFQLADAAAPAPLPVSLERVERFLPDGSMACPSDFRPERVGTDVLVVGSAVAPAERATSFGASLEVAGRKVTLHCTGPRTWVRDGGSMRPGDPGPAGRVALTATMAFGGPKERRNRVGRGAPPDSTSDAAGTPLPQIEWADDVLTAPSVRTSPALVAGIACHCEERVQYAGTYDAAWTRSRAPLPALDRDARFFRVAPSRLAFTPGLSGGDPITLENLGRPGRRTLLPPRLAPRLFFEGAWVVMSLDLVVVDVDADIVTLTFGASIDIAGRLDDRLVVDVAERRVVPLGTRMHA